MAALILHLAYGFMLGALLVRDVLRLRVLLVASQLCFILYAVTTSNPVLTWWNAAFICINIVGIARVLWERRDVTLSPELEKIYSSFTPLTRREFLYVWNVGEQKRVRDDHLIERGMPEGGLFFIVRGTVSLRRGGEEVVRIGRGDFIAETSLLLEERATLEAMAMGEVEYAVWSEESLDTLRKTDPAIGSKVQTIMGRYMTTKLLDALRTDSG